MCACSVALCAPMDGTPPLSLGLPRQEYWSGLPFPPLADLSDPGIMEPESPESPALVGGLFTTETPESPVIKLTISLLQTAFHLLQPGPERQLLLAACCGAPAACTPGCRAPAGPGGSAQTPPAAKRTSGCRHALASPVRSSTLPAPGDCFQRSI